MSATTSVAEELYCPVCLVSELRAPSTDPRTNVANGLVVLGPCRHVVCTVCAPSIIQLGMQMDREFPRCEICATAPEPTSSDATGGAEESKTNDIVLGDKDHYGIGWLSFEALDTIASYAEADSKSDVAHSNTISPELLARYTTAMIQVALRDNQTRNCSALSNRGPTLRKEPSTALQGWNFVRNSDVDDAPDPSKDAPAAATPESVAPPQPIMLSRQLSKVLTCPYCDLPMTVDNVSEPVRTQCGYCKGAICMSCGCRWRLEDHGVTHFGVSCKDFNEIVEGMHGAEAVRRAFLESLPAEVRKTVGKPCPRCGMINVHFRGHGCHHVNSSSGCPGCGYGYCYVCLNPWPCSSGCDFMCGLLCDCPTCTYCVIGKPCGACSSSSECPACKGETDEARTAREAQQALARAAKMAAGWIGPRNALSEAESASVKASGVSTKLPFKRLQDAATRAFAAYEAAVLHCADVPSASCALQDVQEYMILHRGTLHYKNKDFRSLESCEAAMLKAVVCVLGQSAGSSEAVKDDVLNVVDRILQRLALFTYDYLDDSRLPVLLCVPHLYAKRRVSTIIAMFRDFVRAGCGGYDSCTWLQKILAEVKWREGDVPLYQVPFLLLCDETLSDSDLVTVALAVSDMAFASAKHPWSTDKADVMALISRAIHCLSPKCLRSEKLMHAVISLLVSLAVPNDPSTFVSAYVGNASVPVVVQRAAQIYEMLAQLKPAVLVADTYHEHSFEQGAWPAVLAAMAMNVLELKDLSSRLLLRDANAAFTEEEAARIYKIANTCRCNFLSGTQSDLGRVPAAVFHELGGVDPLLHVVKFYFSQAHVDSELFHVLMEACARVMPRVVQQVAIVDIPCEDKEALKTPSFHIPTAEGGPTIEDFRDQYRAFMEVMVLYLQRATQFSGFSQVYMPLEDLITCSSQRFYSVDRDLARKDFLKRFCATDGALDAIVATLKGLRDAPVFNVEDADCVFWFFAYFFPEKQDTPPDDVTAVALRALQTRDVPRICADIVCRPAADRAMSSGCRWLNMFWHTNDDNKRLFAEHAGLVPALYASLPRADVALSTALCNIVTYSPASLEKMMSVDGSPSHVFGAITVLSDVRSHSSDAMYAVLRILYGVLQRKDAADRCAALELSCLFPFLLKEDSKYETPTRTATDVVQMALNCIYRATIALPGMHVDTSRFVFDCFFDGVILTCANSMSAMRLWWKTLHQLCIVAPAFQTEFIRQAGGLCEPISNGVPSDVSGDVSLGRGIADTVYEAALPKSAASARLKLPAVTALAQYLAVAAFTASPNAGVCQTIANVLNHWSSDGITIPSVFAAVLHQRLTAVAKNSTPQASLAVCERVWGLLKVKISNELLASLKDVVRDCFSKHAAHVARKLGDEATSALMHFADIRT